MTKRTNWVIGYPLDHTKSPLLHNMLYENLNIPAELSAFSHQDIEHLVKKIKANNIELTAVTMPHKTTIMKYLDEISEKALALSAVNTVIQKDHKLYGDNTDVDGIVYALRDTSFPLKNTLIIGAGGAARAAGYVMHNQTENLFWFNRTIQNAEKIAHDFGGTVLKSDQLNSHDFDLIINTTPIGMTPHVEESPLLDYPFQPNQTVFDMVYNPLSTTLLKSAQKAHAKTISGIEMFIGQGIRQVELWTNQSLPKDTLIPNLISRLKGAAQ